LAQELESSQASLTATSDKLTTNSSTLDTTVIQEQNMKIQLTVAEENLKAIEEKLKTPWQSLDSARQALSRRELSSSMVISSSVANAIALMKNHLLNLDVEILCKNFIVDDTEREALANNAYDAAHDFVSMYDISSLAESDDNNSPGAL
jgi:prephenate dehydratase